MGLAAFTAGTGPVHALPHALFTLMNNLSVFPRKHHNGAAVGPKYSGVVVDLAESRQGVLT